MLNLTTPIPSVGVFTECNRVKTVGVHDDEESNALVIKLKLLGPSGVEFPETKTITITNDKSNVLRVRPSATKLLDQYVVVQVTLTGNPYTVLREAYHANVTGADKPNGRKKALEALYVSTGAIGPEFAGT